MNLSFVTERLSKNPMMMDYWDAYMEELHNGGMDSTWPRSDLYNYAALFLDDKPITMIFYAPLRKDRMIVIAGAYTIPEMRRKGLYEALWELCMDMWDTWDEFDLIRSGYHKNNKASKAFQTKQGREIWDETETHYRTRVYLRNPWRTRGEINVARLQKIHDEHLVEPEPGIWLTLRKKMLKLVA